MDSVEPLLARRSTMPVPLPIDEVLPQIVAALRTSKAVVLRAPTGAGKTTRVPPAVLDAGLARGGSIVVLQPRRLTARACARRIACERGVALGDEVGYQVRFDRCMGPKTRIQVVTEGIFLRMLQDDPFLESVAAVVFDEFHERSLNSDLALAMVRRVQETVRPELKVVVMSATLAAEPIARWLGGCPVVESQGRLHPVEIRYLEDLRSRTGSPSAQADAVEQILDRTPGDVLVFLPGVGEIRQTARRLEALAAARNLAVLPLYGDLPAEKQDEVLGPIGRRKVVLSTNVAETSLTIEGITAVVDSGLARSLSLRSARRHGPLATGADLAGLGRSAGRPRRPHAAGRLPAAVARADPSPAARGRRAGDSPPRPGRADAGAPRLGRARLAGLSLVRGPAGRVAPAGRGPAEAARGARCGGKRHRRWETRWPGCRSVRGWPACCLEGHRLGQPEAVALAAALLSERDPFGRGEDAAAVRSPGGGRFRFGRVRSRGGAGGFRASPGGWIRPWVESIVRRPSSFCTSAINCSASCGRRCGRASEQGDSGNMAIHSPLPRLLSSPLHPRPLLPARPCVVGSWPRFPIGWCGGAGRAAALDAWSAAGACAWSSPAPSAMRRCFWPWTSIAGGSEALVRQASAVERDWLPADRLALRTEVEFDAASRRVIARRRVYWEDLLLEESPAALPDGEEVGRDPRRGGRAVAGRGLSLGRRGDGRLCQPRPLPGPMDAGVGTARSSMRPGCRPFCPAYAMAAGRWTNCARPPGWRTCKPR